jgi:hypothetical protein
MIRLAVRGAGRQPFGNTFNTLGKGDINLKSVNAQFGHLYEVLLEFAEQCETCMGKSFANYSNRLYIESTLVCNTVSDPSYGLNYYPKLQSHSLFLGTVPIN